MVLEEFVFANADSFLDSFLALSSFPFQEETKGLAYVA